VSWFFFSKKNFCLRGAFEQSAVNCATRRFLMRTVVAMVAMSLLGWSHSAAAADVLPLAHGDYVLASVPCKAPPFAAMMNFDGRGLGGPHVSQCVTKILTHAAGRYTITTSCQAAGDGTPIPRAISSQDLTIVSPKHVILQNSQAGAEALDYRWCSAS
jgi:hypothetical protein